VVRLRFVVQPPRITALRDLCDDVIGDGEAAPYLPSSSRT
jgi:hypothetical protein